MTEIKSGIYRVVNTSKNKYYIGSTSNLKRREKQHFSMLKNNVHNNKGMQEDFNAGDTFIFEVVKRIPFKDHNMLFSEEKNTIQKYKDDNKDLYNVADLIGSFWVTKEEVTRFMLDDYCKEWFGKTYNHIMSQYNMAPAKLQMLYEILQDKEHAEEIENKYSELIKYQYEELYKMELGVHKKYGL